MSTGWPTWTGWDLNPWPPACKAGDLPLIYRPTVKGVSRILFNNFSLLDEVCGSRPTLLVVGGDPSAGSPTDTLLRLSPARRAQVRHRQDDGASPRLHSGGVTGGVCKEQGHIHRGMLTRDYYGFRLHEGEFQPSIRTTAGFRDCLPLLGSEPIVPAFVARV